MFPFRRAALLGLLLAMPSMAVQDKTAEPAIDPAVIAAYRDIGGYHHDGSHPFVWLSWVHLRQNGEQGVPSFQFSKLPKGKLPAVAVPFGLDFTAVNLKDADLRDLADLANLRSLCLFNTPATDAGLKELASLKNLVWLDLRNTRVTGSTFKDLAPLKKLGTLYLDPAQVTDAGLRDLRAAGLLQAMSQANGKGPLRQTSNLEPHEHRHVPPSTPAEVLALNLGGTQVTDAGLKELADLENLTDLSLRGANVTDVGVKELLGFKHLARLDLAYTKVTDAGLKDIADCKNITTLILDGDQVTDKTLRMLRGMDRLHILSRASVNAPFRASGAVRPKSAAEVTHFDLSECQVTDAALKELSGLKNLSTLSLAKTRVTGAGLKELAAFKNLAELSLRYTQIAPTALEDLTGLTKLATLDLSPTQLTDESLRVLSEHGLLHVLSESRAGLFTKPVYNERPKSEDGVISFDLRDARVTDAGLKSLAGLKNLVSLNLLDTQVTGAGLEALARLTKLKDLGLNRTQVTDAGLKELAKLTHITSLDLTDTKITGAGLKELAPLKNLESLYLKPKQITDESLHSLSELGLVHSLSQAWTYSDPIPNSDQEVVKLNLADANITDAGLKDLAGLKNLAVLHLDGTRATEAGIAELRKALPKCRIN